MDCDEIVTGCTTYHAQKIIFTWKQRIQNQRQSVKIDVKDINVLSSHKRYENIDFQSLVVTSC